MDIRGGGKHIKILIGLMVLFAFLGIAAIILDWKEISRLVGQADWHLIPLVFLFTALSYKCIGYGFATANRIFGVRLPQRWLAEIGFVSLALNNLLSAGGAAGDSLRFLVMHGQRIAISAIVTASVFDTYFTCLTMLALVPIGLVNLYLHLPLPSKSTAGALSVIPGGLAVEEGSMSGIYALLGVPLAQAVLAAILFRVIYYFTPLFISLGFNWRMLRLVDWRGSASEVWCARAHLQSFRSVGQATGQFTAYVSADVQYRGAKSSLSSAWHRAYLLCWLAGSE